MFLECDEVAVLESVWDKAKVLDKKAIDQLRDETVVSIKDLQAIGVIQCVTLTTRGFFNVQN